LGLIDKFEHVLLYNKGKHFNFLSQRLPSGVCQVFPVLSAVLVVLVFPQQTTHTSSVIVAIVEQGPSKSFNEFLKVFVLTYVVQM